VAARQVLNRARPTASRFLPCNPVSGSASDSPLTSPIPLPKIDATLDLLTAEELADAPRFVEVWERAGDMSSAEAAAWRERIAIWRRFIAGGLVCCRVGTLGRAGLSPAVTTNRCTAHVVAFTQNQKSAHSARPPRARAATS
jgi:hypothetical protein